MSSQIRIFGAKQNNLKNLNVSFNTGEITVLTGVSGSGKSSLAFDTLYAEGQRKYVETFSPYARQFLDRMDKPQVDHIEGILPAIAIDQTNPVRNSRSSVGTMTELNDHLKLLFARTATLYCRQCAKPVHKDNHETIYQQLKALSQAANDPRLIITFAVKVPNNYTEDEVKQFLEQQGYTRIHAEETLSNPATTHHSSAKTATTNSTSPNKEEIADSNTNATGTSKKRTKKTTTETYRTLYVVQDRFRFSKAERERVIEAIEATLNYGQGKLRVYALNAEGENAYQWNFSQHLHCANCDITYHEALPSTFSFNSPLGACEVCRGFGRTMGIDYGLVVPDENKTLAEGAIKPWQTPTYAECQDDLIRHAKKAHIRINTPWKDLTEEEKDWVIQGVPDFKDTHQGWKNQWYGASRFFDYLESKSYKMHIRVMLSKYRSYRQCYACQGSRLKPDANLWRIGKQTAEHLPHYQRFMPVGTKWSITQLNQLPGLSIHDLMRLSLADVKQFFIDENFQQDSAIELVLTEIKTRLNYLNDVGLSYLSLDRQSRTLSGGEIQRINLTTALGTSLTNTLFVLDEPSIGLHPHDMSQIIQVMQRLRRAGNTLVVVEHDPQVMVAADRILDIGPGPGERGGEIIFDGPPEKLRHATTLTGEYLGGRLHVEAPLPMPVKPNTPKLLLQGASEHNLKNIDVAFPLNRLVCITGVSGSGKSTLIQDVLYPALLKYFNKPTEAPGKYQQLLGAEQIAEVIMVDQSPIGKTARSNPASYVGAFDAIRKIFAQTPIAKERGYTAGTFSFNSGDGRCPTCGGTGFEHIEMQFLSDVYLRCPDCDGKRFKPEILEVEVEHLGRKANIADVLNMTVSEALDFFKGLKDVKTSLQPLVDVGLEYVSLGQPVPTLSGGEAQRLKLAGHLVEAAKLGAKAKKLAYKGNLFLFDEPTTGLHFDDISRLMRAFRKLLEAGHSLIIIEHNMDVIRAADWIIDLGPQGGLHGGEIVAEGTPADLRKNKKSLTGLALADYEKNIILKTTMTLHDQSPEYQIQHDMPRQIEILNAREHNLKNISVNIPHNKFTVITGVSGSGKSTLAFDILFNEGQRRYLESLNAYARAVVQPAGKPEVDAIYGIAPTVAIEQRTSRGGRKSTVGTMTEIHHFLRLLYVKLGTQYCPTCHIPVVPYSPEQILEQIMHEHKNERIALLAPLVTARKGYYTDLAKWAEKAGYTHLRVDGEFIPVSPWPRLDRYKEHTIELPVLDTSVSRANEKSLLEGIHLSLQHGQGVMSILHGLDKKASLAEQSHTKQRHFSSKRVCPSCHTSYPDPDPRLFSYNSKHGWCPACFGTGLHIEGFDAEQTGEESHWLSNEEEEYLGTCTACSGTRLNPVARAFEWEGKSITEISAMSVQEASEFFTGLKLDKRSAEIARDILVEIKNRLNFMQSVGLNYLTLDRSSPTLSGGEAQRIRLAAQLGSNLQGVCYILDEPTIGLHPRDNRILLNALSKLEGNGNTLVVVEHDEDTIRKAEHIIDIGPGAGVRGGTVVAQGSYKDIVKNPQSLTGKFLAHPIAHPMKPRRLINKNQQWIQIKGANLHNLQSVDAQIPLGKLSVITGVSGSGKSSLARDVLLHNLKRVVGSKGTPTWQGCTSIEGWEFLDRVLEVDQTPIGKTPRSCPATYIGFWDDVRQQFAQTHEAKMHGWTASRFSFNTGAGRCPVCEGQGMRTVEMSFLPDMKVPCEACHGNRFNPETLSVKLRDKSVGEVLRMEIDDAIPYFANHPKVLRSLQLLQDVGLGYLTLGQASPTLSGGEAQRIKLVSELVKAKLDEGIIKTGRVSRQPHTLYVLDEPTVGLSMADVEKLIHVLHRLVDAGNTVVVIEHNLDIMAEADWILDMGPEGGTGGGLLVASGNPETLIQQKDSSHTGAVLADFMGKHPKQ
ncbi:excinuclease ABC subunit UvrA [Pelistega europaea]|uniref:UvrABC system protein A n=1 Tax=Pelistega europaea TaxID=106147 RepID=A0A7Y4L9K4_9BURK|nr:excinuclease ABC subunit UvrA [Pelistega europaea]NOL49510.1 excinuclease ABC subunit UvrA [Pelistega europaea]